MTEPSYRRFSLSSSTWAIGLCLLSACSLDIEDFSGKDCERSTDCPSPYSCVQTATERRTCELIQLPAEKDIVEPSGVEADWCTDIKPFMFTYCVECHGGALTSAPEGSQRTDFHLGYYEEPGSAGAKDFGARIDIRTVDKSPTPMPPASYGAQPTDEEIEKVKGWVATGMPFVLPGRADCLDDGQPPP